MFSKATLLIMLCPKLMPLYQFTIFFLAMLLTRKAEAMVRSRSVARKLTTCASWDVSLSKSFTSLLVTAFGNTGVRIQAKPHTACAILRRYSRVHRRNRMYILIKDHEQRKSESSRGWRGNSPSTVNIVKEGVSSPETTVTPTKNA